jgi:hypothetical protein
MGLKEGEKQKFNDWLDGKTDDLPEFLNPDTLPPDMKPFASLFGQYWHGERKKNMRKK